MFQVSQFRPFPFLPFPSRFIRLHHASHLPPLDTSRYVGSFTGWCMTFVCSHIDSWLQSMQSVVTGQAPITVKKMCVLLCRDSCGIYIIYVLVPGIYQGLKLDTTSKLCLSVCSSVVYVRAYTYLEYNGMCSVNTLRNLL